MTHDKNEGTGDRMSGRHEPDDGGPGVEYGSVFPTLIIDRFGTVLQASELAGELLGTAPEALIGSGISKLVAEEWRDVCETTLHELLADRPPYRAAVELPITNGPLEKRVDFLFAVLEEGIEQNVVAVLHDAGTPDPQPAQGGCAVTMAGEERYRLLFERNVAGVFRASLDGRILEVNEAFTRMLGYDSADELRGVSGNELYRTPVERRRFLDDLEKHGALANYELQLVRKDGTSIWVLENSIVVEDPELGEPVIEGTLVDITARKRLEVELERMAYHDPLTDLANRRLLEERARMSLAFADRHGIQAGLVYLDLSRFKRINDTLGHEAGDDVLVEAAARLRACLRGSDTPARIGGDEFAALLAEVDGEQGALAVARRVAASFAEPFRAGNRTLHVDAQVGVALYPSHAADFEGLLAAADRAMYRTKSDGNPAIEIYSPELDELPSDALAEEEELRRAIEEKQLTVHYQPIVRLSDGELIGAEALVRWNHPEQGLLEAESFVKLAERTGLIGRIDRWVLEQAFVQAQAWQAQDAPKWVSINQSARSLREPEILESVSGMGLAGSTSRPRLIIEVHESVAVRGSDVVGRRLCELRDLGLGIALDDFGTGSSTLANVKHCPVDMIKLDGIFIHDLDTNHDSRNLAKAVIQMSQALGAEVVAEKVETLGQWDWLGSAGCDFAQGFLTGAPSPPDEFHANASRAKPLEKQASP